MFILTIVYSTIVMNIECATEGSQYVHRLDSNSTGMKG